MLSVTVRALVNAGQQPRKHGRQPSLPVHSHSLWVPWLWILNSNTRMLIGILSKEIGLVSEQPCRQRFQMMFQISFQKSLSITCACSEFFLPDGCNEISQQSQRVERSEMDWSRRTAAVFRLDHPHSAVETIPESKCFTFYLDSTDSSQSISRLFRTLVVSGWSLSQISSSKTTHSGLLYYVCHSKAILPWFWFYFQLHPSETL